MERARTTTQIILYKNIKEKTANDLAVLEATPEKF